MSFVKAVYITQSYFHYSLFNMNNIYCFFYPIYGLIITIHALLTNSFKKKRSSAFQPIFMTQQIVMM